MTAAPSAAALASLEAQLRTRRVRDLADPARLAPLLDAALGPAFAAELCAPLLRALRPYVLATLRADPRPLRDYVPKEAQAALQRLAARPPRLPAPLARALVENPELEEVLRDLLYGALREFNDRVNPFFADWGLPTILRKVLPIGGGTAVRALELVRGEFDRRLEPEMRRFLQGFVKRGLQRFSQVLAEGKDGPHGPALRRSILEAVLAQPVALLAEAPDDELLRLSEEAFAVTLERFLQTERAAELRREALAALCAAAGDRTLGELLEQSGVRYRLPTEALASLLAQLAEQG